MINKEIHTDKAPSAVGPYSQAIVHNGIAYCSGQIALDPETMEMAGDDIETQTEQVMRNLEAVLLEAGSNFRKVIKCSIFLESMDDFGKVNDIYGSYFANQKPARETVEVSRLPKEAKVEISCLAYI